MADFFPWSLRLLLHSNKHDCNTTTDVRNLKKRMCILGGTGWNQGTFEDYVSTEPTAITRKQKWFSG